MSAKLPTSLEKCDRGTCGLVVRVRAGRRLRSLGPGALALAVAAGACREKPIVPARPAVPGSSTTVTVAAPTPPPPTPPPPTPRTLRMVDGPVDKSLWSAVRIRAYEASLKRDPGPPLGILKIPKIHVEVAVLPGTEDWILDRGAGNIEDTALPGKPGNVGIAGHRDGFFRGLKDIEKGDALELETPWGDEAYRVTDIRIVEQEDVQVLDPTPHPSVTLVTCYPFYFNGHAPKRFIVRAERAAP